MNIEQIMMVEMEGLSQTIKQYSNDNYIISYANQISSIKYPDDSVKFSLLINRLYEWYVKEIDKIKKSEYILAKDSHFKSFEIISFLQTELTDKNHN